MDIRLLEEGDEKLLETFLRPRADSSMFLRANARKEGLVNKGARHQGEYLGAFEGKRLEGVISQFNNGNLIPQAPLPLLPKLVSATLDASHREVRGMVGPADQVGKVIETLGAAKTPKRLDASEGLYTLDMRALRVPGMLKAQRMQARKIEPSDRDLLIDWFEAYEVETLGGEAGASTRREATERFEMTLREGRGYLLLRDGEPVAYSGFNAVLPDAVQIGGVFTPPAERGRGFARAIVAASLVDVAKDGVERAILFTGEDNVAAVTAYRALGFDRVGDFRLTLLA
jgi:RimJ/RimL family protein N-acetyltransferase